MHLIIERLFLLTDTRTYPSLLILWRGLTTSIHLLTFTASAYPPASPVGSPSSTTGFPLSCFLLPDLLYLCGSPFFTKASLLPHRLPRSLTKGEFEKRKKSLKRLIFWLWLNEMWTEAQFTCMYRHVCRDPYSVRGALQQEVDGSVYIFVAVMEGYHALILSLSSYLNQLGVSKKW